MMNNTKAKFMEGLKGMTPEELSKEKASLYLQLSKAKFMTSKGQNPYGNKKKNEPCYDVNMIKWKLVQVKQLEAQNAETKFNTGKSISENKNKTA